MSTIHQIVHKYIGNSCELKINVKKSSVNETRLDFGPGRHVQNIRNCDLFIEDYTFLIYLDVQLYQFDSCRPFDLKDLKKVEIHYNTQEQCMAINLPCMELKEEDNNTMLMSMKETNTKDCNRSLDLWKLKRITDQCYIRINNAQVLLKPESNFDYGFASKFKGTVRPFECVLDTITGIPQPDKVSPLKRTIDRETQELKEFSRDQYKLNFVELQVPEGHDNPMLYTMNFSDSALSQEQQCLLHNLTCKPELMKMPDEYDIMEIDCGLISILLAICYDVRFTSNETNCESGWTRSVLSATLTYFETFTTLKDVVKSFMRSSLTYPLYRNYELSKQCVVDCVQALQSHSGWILKQLLITRDIFEKKERSIFNHYYIDDYIRYLSNTAICTNDHLQMLAHNLKNVLLDIFKKHLGLGLQELETELLKELITDIHDPVANIEDDSNDPNCEDDETTDEMSTESCESDINTSPNSDDGDSSSSDTEEDSVIEQKMGMIKL